MTASSATPGEPPPPAETPEAPLCRRRLQGGTLVRLGDGIEVSLEGFGQFALQLQAQNSKMDWDDIIALAASRLCQVKGFLGGLEAGELEFVATHGRRWKAGEDFLLSAEGLAKIPQIPELRFDPDNLEESCKMLRAQFEAVKLARRNKTLAEHVMECHQAIHRAQERRKELLRARGEEDVGGVAAQDYEAFASEGLVFAGSQVRFLGDYLALRGGRVAPATAERRVLSSRNEPS
jgi:hypothetical protein